jgi:hypothetical protein
MTNGFLAKFRQNALAFSVHREIRLGVNSADLYGLCPLPQSPGPAGVSSHKVGRLAECFATMMSGDGLDEGVGTRKRRHRRSQV